jgi:hypothetical protein
VQFAQHVDAAAEAPRELAIRVRNIVRARDGASA